ncbi:MAG TPA: DUF308 domain-containing protein [Aggregatilineaceae bacterium]|nr:DUF308 domain-containing protein [Aggregatilineaceae bacterium]
MFQAMRDYWWLVLLRGIVAVLFGVFALVYPGVTAVSLVLAFGIFAVADGAINLGLALFGGGDSNDRFMLGLQGVLTGLLGILVLTWPDISMNTLLLAIISFAFVSGVIEIIAAFEFRDFWIGLAGLIALLFAIYAFRFPGNGALAVVVAIGIYSIIEGVILIIASFQVRKVGNALTTPSAG